MILEGIQTAISLGGLLSSRRRRKAEQARLRIEAGVQRRQAMLAEDDIFVEASAMQAQQRLLQEREALAEQASDEALRQTRMANESADITLGRAATPGKTRKRFFDDSESVL